MSEMIERAAKAMYLSRYDGPTVEGQPTPDSFWPDRLDEIVSGPPFDANGYRSMARAAIEAMREPTNEMLNYETDTFSIQTNCHMCGGHLEGWQAMIDAALGKVNA